mgnify:CR=1 FL=1
MEKKYFETVDCNVELPKEDGKYGVVYGDGIDSYYFHLHNIKSEKWTSDENGKHLEFPEYWLRELPAPDSPKVSDEDVERLASMSLDYVDSINDTLPSVYIDNGKSGGRWYDLFPLIRNSWIAGYKSATPTACYGIVLFFVRRA